MNNTFYVGQVCTATCAFNGPSLLSLHRISCNASGQWEVLETPCSTFPLITNIFSSFATPTSELFTWPAALQTARQYSYMGVPGQLALPQTEKENEQTRSLLQGNESWLGCSQDETGYLNGIYSAVYPLLYKLLYAFNMPSATIQPPNSVISVYSNFSLTNLPPQPYVGGVALLPNGSWCDFFYV
jgi:hypothetical protein